ncbi:hypothetical protein M413DRAFT_442260 [Hebeloma cylindrosporum]|uniref:Uncharacterized protein n=1 Tax=Hebeloma cylindrosporum TaxID=76867 RepID=A0A0C3C9Y6_HEBCY|nr:hypothetical protein M413DRAFT_442260 [Hebeloma cylindrosporum h7]
MAINNLASVCHRSFAAYEISRPPSGNVVECAHGRETIVTDTRVHHGNGVIKFRC